MQIKNKFKKEEKKIDEILNYQQENEIENHTVEWFENKYKIKIYKSNYGIKKLSGYKDEFSDTQESQSACDDNRNSESCS